MVEMTAIQSPSCQKNASEK